MRNRGYDGQTFNPDASKALIADSHQHLKPLTRT